MHAAEPASGGQARAKTGACSMVGAWRWLEQAIYLEDVCVYGECDACSMCTDVDWLSVWSLETRRDVAVVRLGERRKSKEAASLEASVVRAQHSAVSSEDK